MRKRIMFVCAALLAVSSAALALLTPIIHAEMMRWYESLGIDTGPMEMAPMIAAIVLMLSVIALLCSAVALFARIWEATNGN